MTFEIQEQKEISNRAYVSDVEETMAQHIIDVYKPSDLKGKKVVQLGSGCGLAGIVMSRLGCTVILAERDELVPLLNTNVSQNDHNLTQPIYVHPLQWNGPIDHLNCRAFDYLLIVVDIYSNDSEMENVMHTLLQLSGNGSRLLLGYKRLVSHDYKPEFLQAKEKIFIDALGQNFCLRQSFTRRYDMDDGNTVFIIEILRTPFSSYLLR
eukprot:TRINITY_DN1958_c0_g1_i2.p1 TRINITY_DN1958_c0_g1~~TRINITY_DN1958_c0_g1_i2.p1  ORF type:complete len:209 (-),score=37.76 TRINITY_DN1958_c0_g1_i2:79-705(-)